MMDLIKRMKPENFSDITALVALYRPGPLNSGMADDYINRKNGRESIAYQHPALKKVLNETYGCFCISRTSNGGSSSSSSIFFG